MSNKQEFRKEIIVEEKFDGNAFPLQNTFQESQITKDLSGSALEVPLSVGENSKVVLEKNQNNDNNGKNTESTKDLSEKYRLIALNTSDLITFTTFDINPIFTFVSPSHKKILGYDEGDLLGRSGLDFIHKDDRQRIMTILLTYIDAKINGMLTAEMVENAPKLDFRFFDKSGKCHYLRSTVDIVNDELLFVSKDITEEKKTQDALATSERKYRNLYNSLRDGSAAVDLQGKITECNTAFEHMLGYSLDELRNKTYEEITPKKWHDFEKKILEEQVIRRGFSDLYEKEYRHKDGKIFPVELQTYAICDNEEKLCGFWAFIRDITTRKQMELTQKENEERIKAIVMNAPIGIAVSDANKHFISANEAFCKILGFSESDLQKMTFKDITYVEDIEESIKKMEDLDEGRISFFSQEKHYIKKDGNQIVGKVIVSAMRNQEGKPFLYIAELEDITERKRKDEALRKSEEKFAKAFKSSPIAIAITRVSDGMFLEFNESLGKLSGYSHDELRMQSSIQLGLWVDINNRKRVLDELFKCGSVYDHEYRFRAKAGNIIVARYSAELIDFSNEQCCLSVLIDITEQKKIEESLRESEEKYRSIVENTQDVIMLTSPDGRVSYISPVCDRVLGYRPDELVGKIPEIFYPEDVEKVHQALSNAMQGGNGSNFEYRILTKNGETKWVSHSWSPILTEDHKLKFIVSVVRNINDSKITEQNLKAKIEELEKYKNVTVNREVKMVDLKNEVNELCKQLNQKPKYPNI